MKRRSGKRNVRNAYRHPEDGVGGGKPFRISVRHFARPFRASLSRLRAYRLLRDTAGPIRGQHLREIGRRTGITSDILKGWLEKDGPPREIQRLVHMDNLLALDPKDPRFGRLLFLKYAADMTGSVTQDKGGGHRMKYRLQLNGTPEDLGEYRRKLLEMGIPSKIRNISPNKHVLVPKNEVTLGGAVVLLGGQVGRGAKGNLVLPPELIRWATAINAINSGHLSGGAEDIKTARTALQNFSTIAISSRTTPISKNHWYARLPAQQTRGGAIRLGEQVISILNAAMPNLALSRGENLEIDDRKLKRDEAFRGKNRWTPRLVLRESQTKAIREEYPGMLRFNKRLRVAAGLEGG